jgi:hypothetical protein
LTTFDDLQAITLRQPGALAGVPVGRALCRRLTAGEAAGAGGAFAAGDVKWRIAKSDFAEQPLVGAIISDPAGMEWTILHVELPATTGCWVCWSHKIG